MNPQPLEARLAHVEGAFVQVGERLNSIDRRLDTIEQIMQCRFAQVDARFDRLESRFDRLESRFTLVDQRFMWLIGILFGTWITTILTVLFHH